ncbi:MAG: hypothetical protein IPP61_03630 [Cytophagaceae bacterium]|nr:hypothetical protein [Cytophagaceae bacterium]MBL0301443.1 hypothetical protein [Cytophagaceae bacterium]MBL0324264.1 hypothetical protein [Cytophagaceae bacterium]
MEKSKKILSITLLIALAIKLLMAPVIFLDYQLRKDFIVRNYCINKNRPEMHCNGKCYLARQIKKAQENDEKQATDSFLSKLLLTESEVKTSAFSDFFSLKSFISKQKPQFYYIESISSKFVISFLKPPRI